MRDDDGSTDIAAPDVELECLPRLVALFIEVVVGVVVLIAVELPKAAMEVFRTALEHHADGAAGGDTVVRGVVGAENVEFGKHVGGGHHVEFAAGAAVIDFAAIDEPVVVVGAHAVEAEIEAGALRGDAVERRIGGGDAGAERGEADDVAAVGGELHHLLAGDEGGDLVGFALDLEGVGFDGDGLAFGAGLQRDVFLERLGDVHHNVVLLVGGEAGDVDREGILADIEATEVEEACAVGGCLVCLAGLDVCERDLRFGENGTAWIGDGSGDFATALGVGGPCKGEQGRRGSQRGCPPLRLPDVLAKFKGPCISSVRHRFILLCSANEETVAELAQMRGAPGDRGRCPASKKGYRLGPAH